MKAGFVSLGVAAIAIVLVYGLIQRQALARQQAEIQQLTRVVETQRYALEQAQSARAIADREARRSAERATELNEIREWIVGNDDDAPMPELLRLAFDRMFAAPN